MERARVLRGHGPLNPPPGYALGFDLKCTPVLGMVQRFELNEPMILRRELKS